MNYGHPPAPFVVTSPSCKCVKRAGRNNGECRDEDSSLRREEWGLVSHHGCAVIRRRCKEPYPDWIGAVRGALERHIYCLYSGSSLLVGPAPGGEEQLCFFLLSTFSIPDIYLQPFHHSFLLISFNLRCIEHDRFKQL